MRMSIFLPAILRRVPRALIAIAAVSFSVCAHAQPTPKLLRVEPDTVALWDFTKTDARRVRDLGPARLALRSADPANPLMWVEEGERGGLLFEHTMYLVPDDSAPPINLPDNRVTIEAWLRIKAEAVDRQMGIIQYAEYKTAGFRLLVEKNGRVSFLVQTGSAEVRLLSEGSLPIGRWTHLAATYDGQKLRLFIDGQPDGEGALPNGIVQPENNNHFAIGYVGAGTSPYFQGVINSIRISSSARATFNVD